MASNATGNYRYLVRAPGARHIRVKQQKQDIAPGGRRRYDTIKSKTVDPNADPAVYIEVTTNKGIARGFRWKDQFKVTATYGTGDKENKKTWRFLIRESKSMTLNCASCVAIAKAPTPFEARASNKASLPPTYTKSNVLAGLASVGTGMVPSISMVPSTSSPNTFIDTGDTVSDSTLTDEAGEGDADVLTVNPDLDNATEEETQSISDELDALVDEGAIVEVPEETEDALAVVEGGSPPSMMMPFDVPPAVEPYVVPAAGALVGAVAGRLLGDRTALGALLGGAAAYLYEETK
jgi:hypothetical protein